MKIINLADKEYSEAWRVAVVNLVRRGDLKVEQANKILKRVQDEKCGNIRS